MDSETWPVRAAVLAALVAAACGSATWMSTVPQVTVAIEGEGRVQSTPAGIACTPARAHHKDDGCAHTFEGHGAIVLQAIPSPGSVFVGWRGQGCGGRGMCVVEGDDEVRPTAAFEPIGGGMERAAIVGPFGSVMITGLVARKDAVYLSGRFSDVVTFDRTLATRGQLDAFVVKYDRRTDAFVWTVQMGGSDHDVAYAVDIMESGTLVVAGSFAGTASFGPVTFTAAGAEDGFLALIDDRGQSAVIRSARRYGKAGAEAFQAVVAAGSDLYVAGATTDQGGVLVRLKDGATLDWEVPIGPPGNDPGPRLAAGPHAIAVLTHIEEPLVIGDTSYVTAGESDVLVTLVDRQSGQVLWRRALGDEEANAGLGVYVDRDGDVYVAGRFGAPAAAPDRHAGSAAVSVKRLAQADGHEVWTAEVAEVLDDGFLFGTLAAGKTGLVIAATMDDGSELEASDRSRMVLAVVGKSGKIHKRRELSIPGGLFFTAMASDDEKTTLSGFMTGTIQLDGATLHAADEFAPVIARITNESTLALDVRQADASPSGSGVVREGPEGELLVGLSVLLGAGSATSPGRRVAIIGARNKASTWRFLTQESLEVTDVQAWRGKSRERIYVAGTLSAQIAGAPPWAGRTDGAVLRIDGDERAWTTIASTGDDTVRAVAPLGDGGFLAAGSFAGAITLATAPGASQGTGPTGQWTSHGSAGNSAGDTAPDAGTAASAGDAFVARFDGQGKVMWLVQIGGPGRDTATHLELSGKELVVAGTFEDKILVGGRTLAARSGADVWLARLDLAGKVRASWQAGAGRVDTVAGLSMNRSRELMVAYNARSTPDKNRRKPDSITGQESWSSPSGEPVAQVARLGPGLELRWQAPGVVDACGPSGITGVVLLDDGSAITSGGTAMREGKSCSQRTHALVSKLSAGGAPLWARSYSHAQGRTLLMGLAADAGRGFHVLAYVAGVLDLGSTRIDAGLPGRWIAIEVPPARTGAPARERTP